MSPDEPVPGEALAEYHALRDKIDAFARGVHDRCGDALSCRAGCAGCCRVPQQLAVSPVEAAAIAGHLRTLPEAARAAIADRARAEPTETTGEPGLRRCVMLEADETCAIYPARPLVCRTQGLPLRYPEAIIPTEAVMARLPAGRGVLTWCPLNFTEQTPAATDALDAARADELLALVNQRFVNALPGSTRLSEQARREAAMARSSLVELGRAAGPIASPARSRDRRASTSARRPSSS